MEAASIAVVAIGRNEGCRLIRCLESVSGQGFPVVYVDSGSTDTSVAEARQRGAVVEELDMSVPFTAARARNAGVQALAIAGHRPDYIQFVDGDCRLQAGWLDAGKKELDQSPDLGIVTGWRSEIHRDHSVYNALCDFEWHRPAGDINACGGDMMVRRSAFEDVGGFAPTVIAAEDDEFCIRVRKAGWKIRRLPLPMTQHDAAMTRFAEWWRRAIRSGHGFAQVGSMHPEYFTAERRRVLLFGMVLPLLGSVSLFISAWGLLGLLGVYGVSYLRTLRGIHQAGLQKGEAAHHSLFLLISKFPNFLGMCVFFWRSFMRRDMRLIEYK